IEESLRIERVLDGCPERPRVPKIAPDIRLLLQLCIGPQHDDVPEDVASRSQALDDVPLDADVGIEPEETRAERRASNQLDICNDAAQIVEKREHCAKRG